MELHHILLSPVVTEKSNAKQAAHVYTFMVNLKANKIRVAEAVNKFYGVDVTQVRIVPITKKVRTVGRGRVITKRSAGKKAFVTIDPKQTIDFNKFSKK